MRKKKEKKRFLEGQEKLVAVSNENITLKSTFNPFILNATYNGNNI